jgi:hypothetical protein
MLDVYEHELHALEQTRDALNMQLQSANSGDLERASAVYVMQNIQQKHSAVIRLFAQRQRLHRNLQRQQQVLLEQEEKGIAAVSEGQICSQRLEDVLEYGKTMFVGEAESTKQTAQQAIFDISAQIGLFRDERAKRAQLMQEALESTDANQLDSLHAEVQQLQQLCHSMVGRQWQAGFAAEDAPSSVTPVRNAITERWREFASLYSDLQSLEEDIAAAQLELMDSLHDEKLAQLEIKRHFDSGTILAEGGTADLDIMMMALEKARTKRTQQLRDMEEMQTDMGDALVEVDHQRQRLEAEATLTIEQKTTLQQMQTAHNNQHEIYQASVNAIEADIHEIRLLNQHLLKTAGGPGGLLARGLR